MKKRILILVLASLVLTAGVYAQEWGSVAEGFQLSIQLERELVRLPEPVIVSVTLKNISKETLSVLGSSSRQDYEIIVKDNQGVSIPLTKYGKILRDSAEEFQLVTLKVKSQEEIQVKLVINRICDITTSGTYFITVKRNVFRRNGKGMAEVISNTIKVKIPDLPQPKPSIEDYGDESCGTR